MNSLATHFPVRPRASRRLAGQGIGARLRLTRWTVPALAWLVLVAGGARAAGFDASYGEHGMALFGGKDGLYASHLPMFHAPHDYQVILRVHLADAAQDAALRARLEGKAALWTVAPEKFELDRLAPRAANPLRAFKADMVLGHFEQGGTTQYAGATVVVERVLLYRRLSARTKRSAGAHYMAVGDGARRFLAKRIDSRPDFDHIVAIEGGTGRGVSVAKQGLLEPAGAALAQAAQATLVGTVYFYTDDLK
jgi:hypothetical protein